MASNAGWNKNVPSGTSSIAAGDDDIRSTKSTLQAAWEEEHYFTDGSSGSAGVHKQGSARAFVGTASHLSNPETGRVLWLTDEHDIAVAASSSSWSKLGAARSGQINTWTERQNFHLGSESSVLAASMETTTDSIYRYVLRAGGKQEWGSGSAVVDTNLYRAAANHLKTDDTFEASTVSTPTLKGVNALNVGTLRVGSGTSVAGIVSAVSTIAADVGLAADAATEVYVGLSSTTGDAYAVSLADTGAASKFLATAAYFSDNSVRVVIHNRAGSSATLKAQDIRVVAFKF